MRRTENKQVTRNVVTRLECDGCGKLAVLQDPDEYRVQEPEGWEHFSKYHSDWDNDSVESHEDYDVCSAACYLKVIKELVEDYGDGRGWGPPTLTVDDKDVFFLKGLLDAAGRTPDVVLSDPSASQSSPGTDREESP